MYYRYKVKSKGHPILKFLIVASLIGGISYSLYEYRQYFMFWKYSENKLRNRVRGIESIKDKEARIKALKSMSESFDSYNTSEPMNAGLHFISGKIHYLLAFEYMPGNFSEVIINDLSDRVPESSRVEFYSAIKDIKSGIALLNGREVDPEYIMILAKSLFFMKYYPNADINKLAQSVEKNEAVKNFGDVRFIALMKVLSGQPDAGIEYLAAGSESPQTIEGRLYTAAIESMAGRSTKAIVIYKDLLAKSSDTKVQKLIYIRLGSIYFKKLLYKESIESYTAASLLDEQDTVSRIWIGKGYFAMGQKDKARAVWSEVLSRDKGNSEAKELLDVM